MSRITYKFFIDVFVRIYILKFVVYSLKSYFSEWSCWCGIINEMKYYNLYFYKIAKKKKKHLAYVIHVIIYLDTSLVHPWYTTNIHLIHIVLTLINVLDTLVTHDTLLIDTLIHLYNTHYTKYLDLW